MHFRAGKVLSSVALAIVVSAASPTLAIAQSETERAGARAAAEAGLTAYNAGRYAEAFDLLSRAETLVHALPHQLYMARASEKQGQLVRAREIYLKISREQLIAGAPRAFIEAQQAAEKELSAVDARLPYLTITVSGASASEVRVTMDEREVPSVLIGVPFPADPGTHMLQATGEGIGSERTRVILVEGKREQAILTVSAKNAVRSAPLQTDPVRPAATVANAEAKSPPSPPRSQPHVSKGPNILAYTALGVGAVGVGLGTLFLFQRLSKQSDADSSYDDCKRTKSCSESQIDSILDNDKKAASAGTIAWVGYGVGAAAISAGIYLLLSGSSKTNERAALSTQFVPYVGIGQVGANLRF